MRGALGALVLWTLVAGAAPAHASDADLGLPTARADTQGMSSERLARLDARLDAYVDAGKLPGYQLAIARRGRIVHHRVYGSMDLEAQRALRTDAIYRIYSMSKVVTGVATMIAVERGLFMLDDPVAQHLPPLGKPRVMRFADDGSHTLVDPERPMRVLDLLRHTSGLTYHFMAPEPLRTQYIEASITPGIRGVREDGWLGPTGTDHEATLGDMVERLGEIPLVMQPGERWQYGVNQDVLGALIEATSGQSFPDFLQEHLFGPLGMRDSGFSVSGDRVERFAACYGQTDDDGMELVDAPATSPYLQEPAMPGGGGGMVSTTRDYLRFAQMLTNGGELDGVRILSRKTVDLMMSNHLPPSEFGDRPLGGMMLNGGRGMGFGLTGAVWLDPAGMTLPVSVGGFQWGGAASTFFWSDRSEEISAVFMTQLLPSNAYPLRAELLQLTYQAIVD